MNNNTSPLPPPISACELERTLTVFGPHICSKATYEALQTFAPLLYAVPHSVVESSCRQRMSRFTAAASTACKNGEVLHPQGGVRFVTPEQHQKILEQRSQSGYSRPTNSK